MVLPIVKTEANSTKISPACHPKSPNDESNFWKKYRGLIFGVLYALFLSSDYLIIKCLRHYHPITTSMYRNVAILIPTPFVLLYYQFKKGGNSEIFRSVLPLKNREKALIAVCLVLRGIFGGLARLLSVWAQQYLSVGDCSIFGSTAPILVICFASICLGESSGFVLVAVAFNTFMGMVLITRPPILTGQSSFDMNNFQGAALSLSAAIVTSCVMVLMRRLRKAHWVLLLLASGLFGVLEHVILAGVMGVLVLPEGQWDYFLVFVAFPTVVFTSQILFLLAFKFEKAGPVSLLLSTGIFFTFLLDFGFFGVKPDIYSYGGGVIVVFGLIVTTLRKWVEELAADDPRRKTYKFLLY